jgi:hypothetical protein
MWTNVLGLAVLAVAVQQAQASAPMTINKSTMRIINSDTLPGNLLPTFMFQQGSVEGGSVGVNIGGGKGTPRPFLPDDTCGDDIFDGAMADTRSPQLPYLTQDQWTCDRKDYDLDIWTMETEDLKVTVTPQFAGKVWGIFDKKRQEEWLFANRAHQPANIGALKSWAAGGAEWNWSPGIIGHSAFSETQVHLARVDTERGPLLRVYEFDRYNGTVWQVDMVIANSSFIAHPKITNPTDVDLRGYWWTCVAIDAHPSTRIFTPATHVAETSREPMRDAPWPYFAEAQENATFSGYQGAALTDNSYLGNHQIGDMFLRIPDTVYTPYIAHTQEDGFVLVHGHPLNGTKFFTWGQSGPGRFMQDFLAGGGKRQGDYAELQVGPAPTQMQNFPVPKNSVREWTEWFKGFQGNTDNLRGTDYQSALGEIDSWIQSDDGMTKENVGDWDSFFAQHATDDVSEVLLPGQPWGYVEELRLGHPIAPGLKFTAPVPGTLGYKEAQPWIELVTTGKFSAETLSKLPLSYQTTDAWYALIQESATKHGMTWLHALHLGVNSAERGNVEEPLVYFRRSAELFPNPIAYRCIAVLQSTSESAWPYFEHAWANLHTSFKGDTDAYDRLTRNLVNEMSFFLQQAQWYDVIPSFAATVPSEHQQIDAFITMNIKLALHKEDFATAQSVLGKECFPTYAKARDDLMAMWNTATEGLAMQAKGSSLSSVEKHRARISNPVPENIGCQYASEVSDLIFVC